MADPALEPTVIVCGLATVDILTRPAPLSEAIGLGVLRTVDEIDIAAGGCVSNVGIALSRLGIPTAAVTTLGNDRWGRILRQELLNAGVDCRGLIERDGGSTSVCNVLVDRDSSRSFLFSAGVARDLDVERVLASLSRFPSAQWLLFGYYSLFSQCDRKLPKLFAEARMLGMKTALDTAGNGGSLDPLREILPLLDLYLPSCNEAAHQTGLTEASDMIDCYRHHGAAGIVGIKRGERGSVVSPAAGQLLHIEAILPPHPIVDTTGAGDTYLAGFIAALVKNRPVQQAAQIAAATAAWSLTQLGATAGVQTWGQTCGLLAEDNSSA